jgi:hypothetical protein
MLLIMNAYISVNFQQHYNVATIIYKFLLALLSGVQTKLPALDTLLKLSAVQTKFPVSLQCFHNHAHLHFNQLTDVCIIYHNFCVSGFPS